MLFDCAQERTCGVASGATTRTRAPASRRLAILDSAMVPAPTTRQGRPVSFRNIGKSFTGFIDSLWSFPAGSSPEGPDVNLTCNCLPVKTFWRLDVRGWRLEDKTQRVGKTARRRGNGGRLSGCCGRKTS